MTKFRSCVPLLLTQLPLVLAGHSFDGGRQEYTQVGTVCVTRCNECNADCGGFAADHTAEHMLNGGYGGWHSELWPVYDYATVLTCTRCGYEDWMLPMQS